MVKRHENDARKFQCQNHPVRRLWQCADTLCERVVEGFLTDGREALRQIPLVGGKVDGNERAQE